MKPFVALLATALLLAAGLAGCSGKKDAANADAALPAAAPVLYLNVTVAGHTFAFTSAKATAAAANATAGNATKGNATHSHSASASASASATGNATKGNATKGNATAAAAGNATQPSGTAPLNVTVQVGAKGLPAGKPVAWTLGFGDAAGNATKGNATKGNATKGNATAATGANANGTKVPATVNHTYAAAGAYNLTFSLRVANGTALTLRAPVTVLPAANLTTAIAPGTALGTLVLDQSGSLTGVQGLSCSSATGPAPDATFPWEFPAADGNGTPAQVSHVSILLTQGNTNLDASLHFLAPDGSEVTSADDSSPGFGTTESIEADGPFAAGAYSVKVVACSSANGSFTLHGEATLVAA